MTTTKTRKAREVIAHAQSNFTGDELKLIYGILQDTWQEIGGDCLNACAENGGDATMKRDEVIEVVLDANYADQHVHTPEQKQVWARYKALPYEVMNSIAKNTFKATRYGW